MSVFQLVAIIVEAQPRDRKRQRPKTTRIIFIITYCCGRRLLLMRFKKALLLGLQKNKLRSRTCTVIILWLGLDELLTLEIFFTYIYLCNQMSPLQFVLWRTEIIFVFFVLFFYAFYILLITRRIPNIIIGVFLLFLVLLLNYICLINFWLTSFSLNIRYSFLL